MIQSVLYSMLLSALLIGSLQPAKPDLKKVEWLLGNWRGEANGAFFYEQWERVSTTEFANQTYSLCNGNIVQPGRDVLRLRGNEISFGHEGKDQWRATRITDKEIVLENPNLAYAQKITHRLTDDGKWHARIEGKHGVTEYWLTRVVPMNELTKQKPAPITGRFVGYVAFAGKEDRVIFVFDEWNGQPRTLVSAPDKAIVNVPAARVCYDPPQLKFALDDGGQMIDFVTEYKGDEIVGKAADSKMPLTIRLTRDKAQQSK